MRTEAAFAFYASPWGQHPSVQILTVGELLAGLPAAGPQRLHVGLEDAPCGASLKVTSTHINSKQPTTLYQ